jgi:hypothetical protein
MLEIAPFLGVAYLLYERSKKAQEEELAKLREFKKNRIRKKENLQFLASPHNFSGTGNYHVGNINNYSLSDDQLMSFLINGYLVLQVRFDYYSRCK